MSELTWEYPILVVFAIAAGAYFFHWLTKADRKPEAAEPERVCSRCKLVAKGKVTLDYRHCPYCGTRYTDIAPPL